MRNDEQLLHDPVKLVVTVTRRGDGTRIVDFYKTMGLHYDFICLAQGTANSEILDYLGLEEVDKDLIVTMSPASKIPAVLQKANEKFRLSSPGRGIIFTIPLTSISARIPQILCRPENRIETEGIQLEDNRQFHVIVTIFNRGHADTIMTAAKQAGAGGGTIVHGRRVGFEDVENVFGFTIQPEKDLLLILAEEDKRRPIMEAITKAGGIHTQCRAMLLSIPVDEIMGL